MTRTTRHQRIVQALATLGDAGLVQVQRATGIPRSTAHKAMMDLCEAGMVRRIRVGKHHPTYTLADCRTCPTCGGLGVCGAARGRQERVA